MSETKETKPDAPEGRLDALVGRELELLNELKDVRDAIKAERGRLAHAAYGVFVGAIVRRRGVEYRVTCVNASFSGRPWLEGSPRRKDGTFGAARRNLYGDWELVPPPNDADSRAPSGASAGVHSYLPRNER
jgi:hypothetical protein